MVDTHQENSQTTPPHPPPPEPPSPSQNRTLWLVLSYLGLLALIPLLVETEDPEVQWHAKHGLVLLGAWIALGIALTILSSIPGVGWIVGCGLAPFLWLVVLIIHIVCIMKALKGEKFRLPILSEFADQWK